MAVSQTSSSSRKDIVEAFKFLSFTYYFPFWKLSDTFGIPALKENKWKRIASLKMNDSSVLGTELWLLAVSVKGMCGEGPLSRTRPLPLPDAGPEQLSCLHQHLRVLDFHEINISCSLKFQRGEDVARLNLGKRHRGSYPRNCSHSATAVSAVYFIHWVSFECPCVLSFLGPGNTTLNKKKKYLPLWGSLSSTGLRGWANRCGDECYVDKLKQGERDTVKAILDGVVGKRPCE